MLLAGKPRLCLQSHWGRCLPVVPAHGPTVAVICPQPHAGTGSGCGGVATLPSKDEHPSYTTASISSVSCSSAFCAPATSHSIKLGGGQITP